MNAGDYSIGSSKWPGISKLIEEAGEVMQICGKLIQMDGSIFHYDGSNLLSRLHEEIADVIAACHFVMHTNDLDIAAIEKRVAEKRELYSKWHATKEKFVNFTNLETQLRREWWFNHGCPVESMYGDDGEMQCTCLIDFRRAPLPELREHVFVMRIKRAQDALEKKS